MNLFAWFWSFCVVIAVLYAALIVWFLNGWKNISIFKRTPRAYTTKVSVVVPFFNELNNLQNCIEGLLHQNIQTTEYEIILVDDASTDDSTLIAKKFAEKYRRVHYIKNEIKGKKQALLSGISTALGNLIVTTDADCKHNEFWLATLVDYFETYEANMIVGPVIMEAGSSLFQKFQQIEFVSLIASGAGAVGINHAIMCNGANLAFKKDVFNTIDDPYNLQYISGDDVFLLHNMKTIDADKIHFVKSQDALVVTPANNSFKAFFNQRFRWVSKAPGYTDNDTKFTAFVVLAISFLMVFGLGLFFVSIDFWKPVLFIFSIKTGIDILFFYKTSEFFKSKALLRWVPLFELFYGFYVMVSAVSLLFNTNPQKS